VRVQVNQAYRGAKLSQNRFRILHGGAGSGKSHYMAQETVMNMLKSGDYKYLIVRKTARSIRHSVFSLIVGLIDEYGLHKLFTVNKTDMSIRCATGSELITSGLDDVNKLKSIFGINRIWAEEASEISYDDFIQLDLRMRGESPVGHQMTLTLNPISELHWIKKTFFDIGYEDSFVLQTTYKDNQFIDESYKRRLEELKDQDYQFYRIYTLGEWGSLGNLVFRNWEKADLSGRNDFDNIFYGLDWGFADDPFAFVKVNYDRKRKEIYILDQRYASGLHNRDVAEMIKPICGNDAVICDSAEPKSISELREYGVKAKGAKKGQGSVEHGIRWLQGHKIYIDESCTDVIKEFSGYKWREDKDGNVIPKPIDFNNHSIDALRYALESEMTNKGSWGWKMNA